MKKIFLFFLIFNMIVLSGCWDRREINELGLVTAVAIDKGTGEYRYSITVEIANTNNKNLKSEVWVGTGEGNSLFDATRMLAGVSSRRIMWAHNNVIIIGESLAREGIIPVVDFFTHNPELRMKVPVIVAKGDAKNYIALNAGLDSPSGASFALMDRYRSLEAESVSSSMLTLNAVLRSKYANPLISQLVMRKATLKAEEGEKAPKLSENVEFRGAAVFKKDKLIGFISPEEALGISWLNNETESTVVTVNHPDYGDKSVSVETKSMKSEIKAKMIKGIPKITVNITGKGDIVEEDGSTGKSINEVKLRTEELINQRIKNQVIQSLEVIQKKYKVDVLGFAAIVQSQNSTEWKNGISDKWQEIFPKISVTVSVKINIESSKLNHEPMNIN